MNVIKRTITNAGGSETIPYIKDLIVEVLGTATLTSSYTLAFTGTPVLGQDIYLIYTANVTIGVNAVTIFGASLTATQAFTNWFGYLHYNGTAWVVIQLMSFNETDIVETAHILAEAITNAKLAKMPMHTFKGNKTAGNAVPADLSVADMQSELSILTTALTSAYLFVGSGANIATGVPLTGVIAITNAGVSSYVANTVDLASMAQINATAAKKLLGRKTMSNGNVELITMATSMASNSDDEVPTVKAVNTGNVWEVGSGLLSVQTKGTGCDASGAGSFAEGVSTIASGGVSHSEGSGTVASGNNSHAGGGGSVSSGENSFAHGDIAQAKGKSSNAIGTSSVAHLNSSKAFSSGSFSVYGDCEKLDLFLKKTTTDNTLTSLLLGDNATTGIEIPADCIIDFECRYVALQVSGSSGTPGDAVTQKITFSVRNLAGTLTILTQGIATTATIVTKSAEIVYYEQAAVGALTSTLVPSISGTKILFRVTGEVQKTVQHGCYVSMIINGFNNFVI